MTEPDIVRELLRAEAARIQPSDDLWRRVADGIGRRRRRRRLSGAAAAAAVLAGSVSGALVLAMNGDGSDPDRLDVIAPPDAKDSRPSQPRPAPSSTAVPNEQPNGSDLPSALAFPHAPAMGRLADATWRDITPPPPLAGRELPVVATGGDYLFVWGGNQEDTDRQPADGALLDVTTATWHTFDGPDGVEGRTEASAIWHDGQFIVVGGRNGDQTEGLPPLVFNPEDRSWEVLPAHPLGDKVDPQLYARGGEIVVAGGFGSGDLSETTTTTGALDIDTGTWRELEAAPWPLSPAVQELAGSGAPSATTRSGIITVRVEHTGGPDVVLLRAAMLVGDRWQILAPHRIETGNVIVDRAVVAALPTTDTVLVAGLGESWQTVTFTPGPDGQGTWGPTRTLPLDAGEDNLRTTATTDRWFTTTFGVTVAIGPTGDPVAVPSPPETDDPSDFTCCQLIAVGDAVLAIDWGRPDTSPTPPRSARALVLSP